MKKTLMPDPWNNADAPETLEPEQVQVSSEPELLITTVEDLKPQRTHQMEYSLEGLKADFPNSRELEQFVFDETQLSLKLKGIDPALKYEIALNVLTGQDIDLKYITGANPYVDNTELIPEDAQRARPPRDPRLPQEEAMSTYHDFNVPHPDASMRAVDAKVICQFKTYGDGSISYEIMGPIERQSVGSKLDKFGRERPEKIAWMDPRTGEQAVRYKDGSYSKMGQRLRTLMESKRVNKTDSVWNIWIDRSFTHFNKDALDNPWLE